MKKFLIYILKILMAVTTLSEDILLVLFFFSFWSILMIIVPLFFKKIGVENNTAYRFLFFLGALLIVSIIVKDMQKECDNAEKREKCKEDHKKYDNKE